MTTIEQAMAPPLTDYGDLTVIRTTIAVRNAGDGLSEGMGIDPTLLTVGSTVYVLLACEVDAHNYKRIKDRGEAIPGVCELEQVLRAGTATLVSRGEAEAKLAAQADRIQRAKEEAQGVSRLPMGEGDGDETPAEVAAQRAHDQGLHADERRDECPSCAAEVEAEVREAAEDAARRNGGGK